MSEGTFSLSQVYFLVNVLSKCHSFQSRFIRRSNIILTFTQSGTDLSHIPLNSHSIAHAETSSLHTTNKPDYTIHKYNGSRA